jgi:hypothetical protein
MGAASSSKPLKLKLIDAVKNTLIFQCVKFFFQSEYLKSISTAFWHRSSKSLEHVWLAAGLALHCLRAGLAQCKLPRFTLPPDLWTFGLFPVFRVGLTVVGGADGLNAYVSAFQFLLMAGSSC